MDRQAASRMADLREFAQSICVQNNAPINLFHVEHIELITNGSSKD